MQVDNPAIAMKHQGPASQGAERCSVTIRVKMTVERRGMLLSQNPKHIRRCCRGEQPECNWWRRLLETVTP